MCEVCKAKGFAAQAMQAYLEAEGHAVIVFAVENADGTNSINFVTDLEIESAKELLHIAGDPEYSGGYEVEAQPRVN